MSKKTDSLIKSARFAALQGKIKEDRKKCYAICRPDPVTGCYFKSVSEIFDTLTAAKAEIKRRGVEGEIPVFGKWKPDTGAHKSGPVTRPAPKQTAKVISFVERSIPKGDKDSEDVE